MNEPSYQKFKEMLKPDGLLIMNSSMVKTNHPPGIKTYKVPATEIASKLGNVLVSNIVMLGAYLAIKNLFPVKLMLDQLQALLEGKRGNLFIINKQALESGIQVIKSASC